MWWEYVFNHLMQKTETVFVLWAVRPPRGRQDKRKKETIEIMGWLPLHQRYPNTSPCNCCRPKANYPKAFTILYIDLGFFLPVFSYLESVRNTLNIMVRNSGVQLAAPEKHGELFERSNENALKATCCCLVKIPQARSRRLKLKTWTGTNCHAIGCTLRYEKGGSIVIYRQISCVTREMAVTVQYYRLPKGRGFKIAV